LKWAQGRGNIHPKVVEFIAQTPSVFEDPDANPRAWAYVSNLLRPWEAGIQQDPDLIATALAGVVGEQWAVAFLQFYGVGSARPLTPRQIVEDYAKHRPLVQRWLQVGQLDLVVASLELLKRHLQRQGDYEAAANDPEGKRNVEAFFSDLPGDRAADCGPPAGERPVPQSGERGGRHPAERNLLGGSRRD
jgi:hypothetical protein